MPTNPPITDDRLRRFFDKTTPVPFCGCLIWLGGSNEHGYGVFWNGARLEKAHRFACRAAGREVPDDADVLHTCDTPACVNDNHLVVGTTQSNVADMWAKGRAAIVVRTGAAQPMAKLTDEIAATIRATYRSGGVTQRELARVYGVSQRVIWNVVNGRNWSRPTGVVVAKGRRK